ncbi:MAG: hypothetical protein KC983_01720 [Phycisphaerales bacterium]|nr:hypothetical protein [Phycisphaerales bacterium]
MRSITNWLYGTTLVTIITLTAIGLHTTKPWRHSDEMMNGGQSVTCLDINDRVERLLDETEIPAVELNRAPGIDMRAFTAGDELLSPADILRYQQRLADARRINHARLRVESVDGSVTNMSGGPRIRVNTSSSTPVVSNSSTPREGMSIFEQSRKYHETGSTYRARTGRPHKRTKQVIRTRN